jgi:hypothetical protein
VVGVDDVVAELELDDFDLAGLELLDERRLCDCLGWNGVLLSSAGNGTDWGYLTAGLPTELLSYVCK